MRHITSSQSASVRTHAQCQGHRTLHGRGSKAIGLCTDGVNDLSSSLLLHQTYSKDPSQPSARLNRSEMFRPDPFHTVKFDEESSMVGGNGARACRVCVCVCVCVCVSEGV